MLLKTEGMGILVIMEDSLAKLYLAIMQKGKLMRNELEYVAQEISKQSIKGIGWFLLVVYI